MTTDNRTNNKYTPTTDEVLGMLGSHLYEYGAECDMNLPGNGPDEIVDRWLAEVERKALEGGWDEGYWQGINGHTGPGNPYRREETE